MNRRHFAKLVGLGLFSILPGAGRVWRVERKVDTWHQFYSPTFRFLPSFQDFVQMRYPSIEENKLLAKLFSDPTVWSPNMADTQRLVICDSPIPK